MMRTISDCHQTLRQSRLNKRKRTAIFSCLRERNPSPSTELVYSSTFELLISVILSAQATDVSVNRATAALFRVANTPESMIALGISGLKKYIRSIGLYNSKAENILRTCCILKEKHGSMVPSDRESLESLPGVGRKTANVILNTAFGQPVIAVDTHLFRVCNRTGIAPGKNVREVEQKLVHCIPDEFKLNAHHWLILHGRYTCTARRPGCVDCSIRSYCEWDGKPSG